METTSRIRRTAFAFFVAVCAIMLRNLNYITVTRSDTGASAVSIAGDVGSFLLLLIMMALCMILLFSVKKGESPFNLKNVRLLKWISIVLIAFEPYVLIAQWLSNSMLTLTVPADQEVITMEFYLHGGLVFVAGLIVYCISLVFQHGIALQKQVDETL